MTLLIEDLATLDEARKRGWNITLWLTPRAVVMQIYFHDEDRDPDIDLDYPSVVDAIRMAAHKVRTRKD